MAALHALILQRLPYALQDLLAAKPVMPESQAGFATAKP
jgi:hypothetical protein